MRAKKVNLIEVLVCTESVEDAPDVLEVNTALDL